MGDFAAIFIIGIITLGVYRLFELFVRKKERLTIIEKMSERMTASDIEEALNLPLFKQKENYSTWALKFSLLFIGIGLGGLTAFFIDLAIRSNFDKEMFNYFYHGTINFACISIFGGLGLFTAYLIEQKQLKK